MKQRAPWGVVRMVGMTCSLTIGMVGWCRADTPTPAAADIQIRATSISFQVGVVGRYVVTLINNGPDATDAPITFSTDLPDGLSFAGIDGNFTCDADGQSVSCVTAESLPAKSSVTFEFDVGVGPAAVPRVFVTLTAGYDGDASLANNSVLRATSVKAARGPIATATTTATATASFGTPVPTRTPTQTRTPTATVPPTVTRTVTATRTPVPSTTDLSIGKNTVGTFTVGSTGTYVLTVSNLGSADTNVPITVVDALPDSLAFVSATGTDWQCGAAGQQVTCTLSTPLPALTNSAITLLVNVSDAAFPTVTNSATVSYAGDTNPANNLARKPTTVRQRHPAHPTIVHPSSPHPAAP